MAKEITITNLTGAEPYIISICNSTFTTCYYYDTIYNVDIPYNIQVPSVINSYTSYGIKAIDSNGCEIKSTISIT